MARVQSKPVIKRATIKKMEEDGTYKSLYDDIIDLYADTLFQYQRIMKQFEESEYEFQTMTAANGYKTAPIMHVIENLRKDLMQLSDRLQLNPKANPPTKMKKGNASPLRTLTSKYGT